MHLFSVGRVEIYTLWQCWQSDFSSFYRVRPKETSLPWILVPIPLYQRSHFLITFRRGKWISVVPISIANVLVSRISQCLPLPVALLSSPHPARPIPQTPPTRRLPSPSFTFPYNPAISAVLSLSLLSSLSASSLLPLSWAPLPTLCLLSLSPRLSPLLATSSLLAMFNLLPCSGLLEMPLGCALPHIYNKTLPHNHTLAQSCPQ